MVFKKLKDDSIYSPAFHFHRTYDGENIGDVIYTGDDFVYYNPKDSTGIIKSKSKWAKEIQSTKHNYILYEPLTNHKSYPFLNDSGHFDGNYSFKCIGEEVLHGMSCFHIEVNVSPQPYTQPYKTTLEHSLLKKELVTLSCWEEKMFQKIIMCRVTQQFIF